MSDKITVDDVRRLMREVTDLKHEVAGLAEQRPSDSKPPVQRILVTQALSTGVAFGVGLMLAPVLVLIVLYLIGGLSWIFSIRQSL